MGMTQAHFRKQSPLWEKGPLSVRHQPVAYRRGAYVVCQRKAARGAPTILERHTTLEEAITWAELHLPVIEAGGEVEPLASRVQRQKARHSEVKALMSGGQESAVPVDSWDSDKEEDVSRSVIRRRYPWTPDRFDCIIANPVAQVWLCRRVQASRKGHRSKTGKHQWPLDHAYGDMAVTFIWMDGDRVEVDAMREPDGRVKVFKSVIQAEGAADRIYLQTPEEDRLPKQQNNANGRVRVFAYNGFDVYFDPEFNGTRRPFDLVIDTHGIRKCVPRDYSKSGRGSSEYNRKLYATQEGAMRDAIVQSHRTGY